MRRRRLLNVALLLGGLGATAVAVAVATAVAVAVAVAVATALALAVAQPAAAQGDRDGAPRDAGAVALKHDRSVPLKDDRGVALNLATPPARIVSLLPSLTESVCALGGCARLVGTDRFSNSPASVLALPKLGGLEDAQVERIVRLKPDLVLATPGARVIARLEALNVPVLALESRNLAEVQRSLVVLARVLGTPDEAARVAARIEREMQAAAERVPAALRGQRVYFEVDPTPHAAGAASFIGETLARLGLGNVAPAELGPFPRLNPEFVLRAQPDIVMATRRGIDEMAHRPGWAALRALQQRRSCGFDAEAYEVLVRPGPRMGEAALTLADCLARLGTLP